MIPYLNFFLDYFSGLIFALKGLSFLAFCFYFVNEIYLLSYQKSLFLIIKNWCFANLIKYRIVVIEIDSEKEKSQFIFEKVHSNYLFSFGIKLCLIIENFFKIKRRHS